MTANKDYSQRSNKLDYTSIIKEVIQLKSLVIDLQEQLIKQRKMSFFSKKKNHQKIYDENVATLIPLPDDLLYEKIRQEVKEHLDNKKDSKSDQDLRQWIKSAMPK